MDKFALITRADNATAMDTKITTNSNKRRGKITENPTDTCTHTLEASVTEATV